MQGDPPVTVTTVLYNSEDSLPRYAAALGPGVERGLIRLIAVDNASPDASAAELRRLLGGAEVLDNPANLGFAAGCNRAWPLVESKYWMLVNPDVEADAAGVERLVEWMDRHPGVGLASPRLRGPDGAEVRVARAHDSLVRPLVRALRLHKLLPRRSRTRWLLPGEPGAAEIVVGWVPGAAMIARAGAVAEVGPLDESFFMYGEDREWCWRMSRAGWQVGVCEDVTFTHGHGTSAKATWDERERVHREVAGQLKAARRTRGRLWARWFALVASIVILAESLDPRWGGDLRDARRLRGRLYLRFALRANRDV